MNEETINELMKNCCSQSAMYVESNDTIKIDSTQIYGTLNQLMKLDSSNKDRRLIDCIENGLEDGKDFILEVLFNSSYKKINLLETTDLENKISNEAGYYGRAFVRCLIEDVRENLETNLNKKMTMPFPELSELTLEEFSKCFCNFYDRERGKALEKTNNE